MEDIPQSTASKPASQVRITLSTQHEEFELPQDVRTVLVSTSMFFLLLLLLLFSAVSVRD